MIDYRKIFNSREVRQKLLNILNFVPDKVMLKVQYYLTFGRKLNLKMPERYTEKVQWYKLYYHDPLMKKCSDKYDVRQYVTEKGLDNILNECYGVYDSIEEINLDELPDKFVLKDTMGSGGTSIIFVHDKATFDFESIKGTLKKWLDTPVNRKSYGREWGYDGIKHRIIAEKMLLPDSTSDLPDYKFFCFNSKVFCSYFMKNYSQHPEEGVLGFCDRDFKLLPAYRKDFKPLLEQPEKPENYELMLEYAEKLAQDFPHVRVDFYNINGQIIFGELTFYNASGYTEFNPDSFDFTMGKEFVLPERKL